jgi:hypothetical protein
MIQTALKKGYVWYGKGPYATKTFTIKKKNGKLGLLTSEWTYYQKQISSTINLTTHRSNKRMYSLHKIRHSLGL